MHQPAKDLIPFDRESRAIYLAGSLIGSTWRYKRLGALDVDPYKQRGNKIIYCFWHSHLLMIAYAYRGCGVHAVISDSTDGDRIAAVAQRWHHDTIRGSSSVNASYALRQCIRTLHKNDNIAITPDGPLGPAQIAKGGIGHIALLSDATIVPLYAHAQWAFGLKTWDRFIVPLPFSRITITIGKPIHASMFDKTNLEEASAGISRLVTDRLNQNERRR